ncbi:MAG: type IV toxin-antitoxin system AbiEi family antitoxin [Burkholderiales bacterium]|nr:type IV toxin-antitoxin system AbiEi family antitoxin [Burkholderiales bacterium]
MTADVATEISFGERPRTIVSQRLRGGDHGRSPFIRGTIAFSSYFAYDWGMSSLAGFLDQQLARGRAYFSRKEALDALGAAPQNLAAAISRLIRKRRLANPRHGFYLILRPEDQPSGAPDPVRWIDPLMKHQGIDYRISLLRGAAFHGSSHQAVMVFQVIVPETAARLRDRPAPPTVHLPGAARLRPGQSTRVARADEERGGLRQSGGG